ncbi:hypothetical protein K457DRAFT_878066 [Linnemannia elongata AG-77]|uniref:Uncharacterized protein n=1 Tax=Linnemannia elongata AG-77 TaxID=1314771 RepID=A0A197JG26_9FUNG|nr:hypothetical protein K457DRAFT_878066 [Linnemannia elongata AG-77]
MNPFSLHAHPPSSVCKLILIPSPPTSQPFTASSVFLLLSHASSSLLPRTTNRVFVSFDHQYSHGSFQTLACSTFFFFLFSSLPGCKSSIYQPFLTLPLALSFPPNSVIASSLLILFSLLLFPYTHCINGLLLMNQHSLLPNRKSTLHNTLFSGKRILFFFLPLQSLFCSSLC